jgi:hypothetical protein
MYDLYQDRVTALESVLSLLRGKGADWGERLPPSDGPAQAEATPGVAFRAIIEPYGAVGIEIAL